MQQLAIDSTRGVVTPAEKLMVIVPDRRSLIVEVMVANRDIGFVRAGRAVKVKVAAFSFTRYGLMPGRVIDVSRDAIDDTPRDTRDQQPGSEPDLDGGEGSGYVALISLDRDTMMVDGRGVRLEPGMSVTAEVLTGQRRVISFLISPLMRYAQDAGQER